MEAADWTGLHVGPATMGTWTVPAPPPTTVTVTLTSVPTGLGLTVDGASWVTTCRLQGAAQASDTIAASSAQNGMTGTRYVFAGWSDGGAQSHSITTPASATTYTASFTTQFLLTTTAASGGAIAPNSGWYNAGTSMTVTASPSSGYVFTGFSGALSGTNNAQQLTINGPASVAANFAILTTMAAQSMGSLPTGWPKSSTDFYILNDGTQKTLPYYLYEKKTGKPLDASKIDPSSLSAGSNVTVTLGSVPSLCAPGDNSVFDLTFSATSLASTGAHTVSFVWNGEPVQTVTLSGAFSVKDATPHINPVQQFPPAPNGSFYSTLYGTNLGPAPGSVAACVQGASQCNGTPDLSITDRALVCWLLCSLALGRMYGMGRESRSPSVPFLIPARCRLSQPHVREAIRSLWVRRAFRRPDQGISEQSSRPSGTIRSMTRTLRCPQPIFLELRVWVRARQSVHSGILVAERQ